MNVRNCRNCGRIFNYVTGNIICPACRSELEEKFQEVKKYVQEHRGVGISQVAEACDVEPQIIQQWLRDERLEVTEDSAIFLNCEKCGAPIRSGRYCDACRVEMTNAFRSVTRRNQATQDRTQPIPATAKKDAKMRYL
ncbi:MAG: flagellar protein [Lachnospiraceae bacterium]|nr:flagellar protein [Lachnospiraceae bacterium]